MNDNSGHGENDKVVLTLENVFHQFTPYKVGIGDLFFTPNYINYVTYFEFSPEGTTVTAGAGRVSARFNPRVTAAKHAVSLRYGQWGLNMHERLERNGRVLTIRRSDIRNMCVNNTLSFDERGGMVQFDVKNLSKYATALAGWFDGSLVENQEGCIVASNHTAPILVVEALLSGDQTRIHSGELEVLATDDEYMTHLCRIVMSLQSADRLAILAKMKEIGGQFPDRFSVQHSKLRNRDFAQIGAICLGGILLVGAMCAESSALYFRLSLAIASFPVLAIGLLGDNSWFARRGGSFVRKSGILKYETKARSLTPQSLTH